MYLEDCAFCQIAAHKFASDKIYEDENYFAFLDRDPIVPGHTLIIPKEHFPFLWDIPDVGEYYRVVQKIGQHYLSKGYKYVDTLTLGRMVAHVHVQLIPHNAIPGNADDQNWNQVRQLTRDLKSDAHTKVARNNPDLVQLLQLHA